MLSKEEIEKAESNLLRGNDIESACLIMKEVIWGNLVQVGGRVNIVKVAMRQILNFIEEYKDRGYLDVVKEKVQLKEKNNQLEQENKKQNKIINEMALAISSYDIEEEICKNLATPFCNNEPLRVTADVCARCVKQYFEKKG